MIIFSNLEFPVVFQGWVDPKKREKTIWGVESDMTKSFIGDLESILPVKIRTSPNPTPKRNMLFLDLLVWLLETMTNIFLPNGGEKR